MEQKRILSFMICMILLFGLNSCIKEEALNTEADIEQASIPNDDLMLSTAPSIGNKYDYFQIKTFFRYLSSCTRICGNVRGEHLT